MTQKLWTDLQGTVSRCQKCHLGKVKRRPSLGVGNPEADLLFVMETAEDARPVTGDLLSAPCGKLMEDFLQIIAVNRRTDLYLTSILKCYPTRQRAPLSTEYRSCLDYLRKQVLLVKPTIIVCFGQKAAHDLISPDFNLATDHGTFTEKAGIYMTGFFPFQEVLRDPNLRPMMLEDMTKLETKRLELTLRTTGEPS